MVNSQTVEPVSIGDGLAVTWRVPMFKSAGIPKMTDVAIQVLEAVPAGMAANIITGWIMNRFKGRAEKIMIARQEIEFDEGKVKRIVFETITRERSE
ncbi:MAG: hypothetical protein WB524_09235 [Acidobacteriaceae bacterium]